MADLGSEPLALWFWPARNGFKVAIMREELGAPYVLRMLDVDGKGERARRNAAFDARLVDAERGA